MWPPKLEARVIQSLQLRPEDEVLEIGTGSGYLSALLAKRTKSFQYQRALMPGGTCEATVYDAYGFTAASICVPLGNYHNMDAARKKIGPEYIDLSDWNNMVKLFIHLARTGHEYEPGTSCSRSVSRSDL